MSNFIKRHVQRVMALMLCIGALPFVNNASAYAQESVEPRAESQEVRAKSEFTYGAQARVQAAYLWRGLYAGGANIQGSVNVGYYGVYADMWWNLGVTDMTFREFQPEVDFSIGFRRWGLDIYALYIYNFNCGFFDFGNYIDKGNRLELNVRYTISDKIPLTFAWGTRVAASDCYLNAAGEIVRAYSSYAEISYTQALRDGWSLFGAIGVTPWKGVYNPNGAALQNIEVRVRKDWTVSERCGLMLQGQLSVNPMAATNVILPNLAFGVYLK